MACLFFAHVYPVTRKYSSQAFLTLVDSKVNESIKELSLIHRISHTALVHILLYKYVCAGVRDRLLLLTKPGSKFVHFE